MPEALHWLPTSVRVQFKDLILVRKTQQSPIHAMQYRCDLILPTLSATSLRPLRSSDRLDLFIPHIRTFMAQLRSFESIRPSLWNRLPPLRSAPPSSLVIFHLYLTPNPAFSLVV